MHRLLLLAVAAALAVVSPAGARLTPVAPVNSPSYIPWDTGAGSPEPVPCAGWGVDVNGTCVIFFL